MLLAAAPFAPVVPVFARIAGAGLALAAGLTALFPLLSVVFTPFVFQLALKELAFADSVRFDARAALFVCLPPSFCLLRWGSRSLALQTGCTEV